MSKSNKKIKKYNPEEVVKDIDAIIGLLSKFENTPLENLDVEKFGKEIDNVTKGLIKKYPEHLDSKE